MNQYESDVIKEALVYYMRDKVQEVNEQLKHKVDNISFDNRDVNIDIMKVELAHSMYQDMMKGVELGDR